MMMEDKTNGMFTLKFYSIATGAVKTVENAEKCGQKSDMRKHRTIGVRDTKTGEVRQVKIRQIKSYNGEPVFWN